MEKAKKIFSQLYDENIDKIYRFVYLKVNSKETAEDLTSETFLRGWDRFKDDGHNIENPRAFLYRIARNLVTDYYREKGKAQTVSVDYVEVDDPKQDIEEKAIFNSDLDRVKVSLAAINDDYQDIIICHYLNDLSVPEIAKLMDKSEEAVRVSLHRALKALKLKCEEV